MFSNTEDSSLWTTICSAANAKSGKWLIKKMLKNLYHLNFTAK